MVSTRRGFRFTIGQGMMVIAALAVAFAIMPMPVAIIVAFLTSCLVVLGRKRPLRPTPLSKSFGCLFCFCGLAGGMVVGSWFLRHSHASGRVENTELFWALFCGLFSALTAGIYGQFLGTTLSSHQNSTANALDSKRAKTQAELELVDQLLRRAHEGDDEIVISKLSEYRAKLEHELQL